MIRVVLRKIVLLVAGPFLIVAAHAQPELQERCARQAAQMFQKEWGGNAASTNKAHVVASYESHYSPRFSTCFYLEITTTTPRAALDKTTINTLRLYDLGENREYGAFIGGSPLHVCKVRDTPCSSEAEWRVLVKSFMEE
ncbi:hypothetical protein KMZ93_03725 [Bradyrhizobium sediminis]|uniref:Uncharacterized protein n=1 Tax=Bradyrhizobium sediminis TaxID=2840469 RepID=A0A975P0H5_9BRAD|nr:hypothetical protein [Bradyrhizobium sediminis]QWG24051.1 hypothetical protein KMZ93_03725 [Bradyrhizobium sediminis]